LALNRPSRTITAILFSTLYIFSIFISAFSIGVAAAYAATVSAVDDGIIDPQLRREREIGRRSVEQIERQWELVADPARIAHLTMIMDNLKSHLERDIPYEIRIIRSDIPNAFCLPGGFIFITTRMLELLSSDSEIAAIMAHEMIHVDRSHGMQMAARATRLSLAALAVTVLSGGAMAPTILAQVGQIAMTNAYSIEFEKEADSMGMDVLIAAGYSPSAMVTLMEKFMHLEMKRPIMDFGIGMTHPEAVERVGAMRERLRSLNIPIERKIPLQLLRTSIKEDEERIRLLIDNVEVWGGEKNRPTLELLEHVKELLDRNFQMELAPFDLRLEDDGEIHSLLRLKNNTLAKTPLPEGMPDLATFRGNLMASLARAQSQHPIAKFFR